MIKRKNLQLVTSSLTIVIVALAYGLFPNKFLSGIFDFTVESIDLKQVFRAMMGLYLGMVAWWVTGVLKPQYWRAATITNVLFMLGLASGRILSLIADGIPSVYFIVGLGLELLLAAWGIGNLYKEE